jgi:hypothetical protein
LAFGVTWHKRDAAWIAKEVFLIRGDAKGYGSVQIRGVIAVDEDYPGCPFCGGKSFFQGACGHLACWDAETYSVVCPVCDLSMMLGGEIEQIEGVDDV